MGKFSKRKVGKNRKRHPKYRSLESLSKEILEDGRIDKDELRMIRAAMTGLPRRQREVAHLVFYEELAATHTVRTTEQSRSKTRRVPRHWVLCRSFPGGESTGCRLPLPAPPASAHKEETPACTPSPKTPFPHAY